jgi:hypothetical protein
VRNGKSKIRRKSNRWADLSDLSDEEKNDISVSDDDDSVDSLVSSINEEVAAKDDLKKPVETVFKNSNFEVLHDSSSFSSS